MALERDARAAHDLVVARDGLLRDALAGRPATIGAAQVDLPEVVAEPAPLHGLHQPGGARPTALEGGVGVAGEPFGAIHLREGYGAARTEP